LKETQKRGKSKDVTRKKAESGRISTENATTDVFLIRFVPIGKYLRGGGKGRPEHRVLLARIIQEFLAKEIGEKEGQY